MNEIEFWRLIEESGAGDPDCDAQAERLKQALARQAPADILAFDKIFGERLDEACHWDLWAAAVLINGGASDDGFLYFRCWLVAQGQAYFERALANPDRAGDNVEKNADGFYDAECEALLYAPAEAYRAVTGRDAPPVLNDDHREPGGEPWDDEDELAPRFPTLWAKFAD